MADNESIQQALLTLESDDLDARAAAIERLGEAQYTPAIPRLTELLPEADPGTRFIIVKALGKMIDETTVPALLDSLRGDDVWTRAAATGSLIRLGSPAVNGLTDALSDGDKHVRRAAAKALGKIGERGENDDVVRALSKALLDVDKAVRRFAAEALGRVGAETMVPELTETLQDKNAEVRIAAFKALAELGTPEAQKAVRNWVKS